VIERAKLKVQEKEKEMEETSAKGERTHTVDNDDYIAETFQTKSFKDRENFIPRQASDFHGERGFTVKSFDKDAQSLSMDLKADDGEKIKKQQNAKKWDRKRKKFVTVGGNDKVKKIKTESGSYIKASYKSNRYGDWMKQNKFSGLTARENPDEMEGQVDKLVQGNKFSRKRKFGNQLQQGGQTAGGPSKKRKKGVLKSKDEMVKNRLNDMRKKSFEKSKNDRAGGSSSRGGRKSGGFSSRGGGRGGRGGGRGGRGGGRGGRGGKRK